MRASTWVFGIGLLFGFAGVAMLFTQNPWGAVLPFVVSLFLCLLGFVETEPVEREFDRRLEEARGRFDK